MAPKTCCTDVTNCAKACCANGYCSSSFLTAVKQAAPTSLLGLEGWYEFAYPGGSFPVCIRPGGSFFCPSYQEASRWCVKPATQVVAIAWGQYGCYELEVVSQSPIQLSGSAFRSPADWRKMQFAEPLSPVESKVLGAAGQGSEWKFVYAGGEFPVQFRGDGYNRFVCVQYPADAHWSLGRANRDELTIHWGQHGTYEIRINPADGSAEGCLQGNPTEWRRMVHIRDLEPGAADT